MLRQTDSLLPISSPQATAAFAALMAAIRTSSPLVLEVQGPVQLGHNRDLLDQDVIVFNPDDPDRQITVEYTMSLNGFLELLGLHPEQVRVVSQSGDASSVLPRPAGPASCEPPDAPHSPDAKILPIRRRSAG